MSLETALMWGGMFGICRYSDGLQSRYKSSRHCRTWFLILLAVYYAKGFHKKNAAAASERNIS